MKTIFGALIAVGCLGCVSVPNRMQSNLDKIIVPEVDFRDADLADAIVFLVDAIEDEAPRQPPRLSIIVASDPLKEAEKKQRFTQLRRHCQDKKVTLNVRYCTLRTLMDFMTGCAGLSYRVQNGHVAVTGANGEIIVR